MLMYKRLCAILDFIQTSPEADRAKIQSEANNLTATFIQNYEDFFEMMVLSSKFECLEAVARKCLAEKKTLVLFLRRTGSSMYNVFKKEAVFKDMPYSALM